MINIDNKPTNYLLDEEFNQKNRLRKASILEGYEKGQKEGKSHKQIISELRNDPAFCNEICQEFLDTINHFTYFPAHVIEGMFSNVMTEDYEIYYLINSHHTALGDIAAYLRDKNTYNEVQQFLGRLAFLSGYRPRTIYSMIAKNEPHSEFARMFHAKRESNGNIKPKFILNLLPENVRDIARPVFETKASFAEFKEINKALF